MIGSVTGYGYKKLTASGQVKASTGTCIGVLVSSSSSGTIKLWDSTAASGDVLVDTTDTITAPMFLPVPAEFAHGLYVTIGGTATVTVFYV